ncbi:MAG: hypothetical protein II779_17175, partial [Clostridia bacterium]|nr:hypothetical protein [Clostridia bacterium]
GSYTTSSCSSFFSFPFFFPLKNQKTNLKHHVILRTLSPFHARLNHRRKAAGFILRMFLLHEHRPRGVVSMSRASDLQSAKAREDSEPIFDTETRVPSIPAKRSHIKIQKSRNARPPMRTNLPAASHS